MMVCTQIGRQGEFVQIMDPQGEKKKIFQNGDKDKSMELRNHIVILENYKLKSCAV